MLGTRAEVVREADVRTHEYAVLDGHAMKHGNVVLDLHAVADDDAGVHEDTAAEDASLPDARPTAHVAKMPDLGFLPDGDALLNLRSRMHEHGSEVALLAVAREALAVGEVRAYDGPERP